MPAIHTWRYCGSSHPPRQCPAYAKKCTKGNKIGHFRVMCRSRRARAKNEVEQEAAQDSAQENRIDSGNINAIHFSKNPSTITAKLKTLVGINYVIVPYKVDTDNDGNIMPLHIYEKLFPEVISEQLAPTKNESIQLKTYNKTTINDTKV